MLELFRRLSISKKIAVVFVTLLFMMGVGGMVGLFNARQIANVTERLYVESFKRAEVLSTVENEFLTARQEMLLYSIISEAASRSYLEGSIDEHKDKIKRLLREYKAMGIAKDDEGVYAGLLSSLENYWAINKRIEEHTRKGQRISALALMRLDGNKSFMETVAALRQLIKKDKDIAYAAYKESDYHAGVIILVTIAFTAIGIVFAGGLWLALTRSIVRPILSIEDSAKKIGAGNLKHRVTVASEDEIGSLALEFNRMTGSLEESYSTLEDKVRARTDELSLANEELSAKKQELEEANIALKEANRMKSQFLANVSHELRTPLNSIIGFSELLQERAFGELNDRQQQYVDYIRSSGGHLLQLINNILDLSKIEAGRMDLSAEDFSVTEALGEILGIIRPLALKRNITIESKSLPASPLLRADKAKFKQIMLNLLSNSVKFNIENGRILVDWRITEEPRGLKIERFITFSIKDTGIGIRGEDKGRLFKEFEQIDSSITREYGGTGLGLVLTKRLVELHNGEIWFESEHEQGTTFYVKLPQGTEEMDMPVFTDIVYSEEGAVRKPLVLLACEGHDINQLLAIYLSGGHFDVATAVDGFELVRKAHEQKPFAIIMGITIPKMDGWEALKSLKADAETGAIPVIIISSIDNRELGIAFGAVEYMEKPVNKDKLLAALERLKYPANAGRGIRVLFADDNKEALERRGDFLKSNGFTVIKAELGADIASIAADEGPDVIAVCCENGLKLDHAVVNSLNDIGASGATRVMLLVSDENADALSGDGWPYVKVIKTTGSLSDDRLLSEVKGAKHG